MQGRSLQGGEGPGQFGFETILRFGRAGGRDHLESASGGADPEAEPLGERSLRVDRERIDVFDPEACRGTRVVRELVGVPDLSTLDPNGALVRRVAAEERGVACYEAAAAAGHSADEERQPAECGVECAKKARHLGLFEPAREPLRHPFAFVARGDGRGVAMGRCASHERIWIV